LDAVCFAYSLFAEVQHVWPDESLDTMGGHCYLLSLKMNGYLLGNEKDRRYACAATINQSFCLQSFDQRFTTAIHIQTTFQKLVAQFGDALSLRIISGGTGSTLLVGRGQDGHEFRQ
jgi:cysteine synthase